MTTREHAGIVLCLALAVGACRQPRTALEPPNAIFIVIDCLRSDHVGAYGHSLPTTPSLDALAREGTVFEHAYSQGHWTRPSVASYLTGLYPSEHGLLEVERGEDGRIIGPALAREVTTLAEEFQAAGYLTAMVGEQDQLAQAFRFRQGFDFYRNDAGKASLIGRGFVRWLDRHQGEGKIFGYLHYLDIHWPYCPPKRFKNRFDSGESSLANCFEWGQLRDRIRSGEQELSAADVARLAARYDEELVAVDASLATLFRALESRGLWDETLIVVSADHGEEFMEYGSVGHSGGLWDVLLSVPLIVKPPRSWPGEPLARVSEVVELRSIISTFREAIGAAPGRGGPSLVPFVLGEQPAARQRYAFAESTHEVRVRSVTHALIVNKQDGSQRLFDRTAEALERTDVSASQPEVLAELSAALRAWRAGLRPIQPAEVEVDEKTIEGLQALGYID